MGRDLIHRAREANVTRILLGSSGVNGGIYASLSFLTSERQRALSISNTTHGGIKKEKTLRIVCCATCYAGSCVYDLPARIASSAFCSSNPMYIICPGSRM